MRIFYLLFYWLEEYKEKRNAELNIPFINGLGEQANITETFCPYQTCFSYEITAEPDKMINHCCPPCISYNTHDTNEFRCVKTSKGNPSLSSIGKGQYRYSLQQYCPATENRTKYTDIFTKCMYPNDEHLDEIIPVYSRTTEQNYRNIHCAKCNNDYFDIIRWESEIVCNDLLELFVAKSFTRLKIMLEDVRLLLWNPPSKTAQICIDDRYLISNCPRFRLPHKFQDACKELHNPVIGYKGVYKNVYCLACNENLDACYLQRNMSNIQGKISIITDSALLSMETEEGSYSLGQCPNGELSNQKLSQCINKTCPFGHKKVGNSCRPLVLQIAGASLSYHLRFLYKTIKFNDNQVLMEARRFVLHHKETAAAICNEEVIGVAMEGYFIAVMIKMTKYIRQRTSIYKDYEILTSKISFYNSMEKEEDFPVRVEVNENVKYTMTLGKISELLLLIDDKTPVCPYPIAMTTLQFCDLVIIPANTCENSIVTLENGIVFYKGEYVNLYTDINSYKIVVCYDTYVSKMKMAGRVSFSSGD